MNAGRMAQALAFLLLALACTVAAAAAPIVLEPVKVSEHVYYFKGEAGMATQANKGFMSNAGFVVTSEGVVAYDALATPVLGEAMIAAIGKVTKQPIRFVVAGHFHADHVYGLQAFRRAGAVILGHPHGQAYIQSAFAQQRLAQRRAELGPWIDEKTVLTGADRWLAFAPDKTYRFTLGGLHFRVTDASGAHSDEDLMLFVEEDRVLFAGDLMFSGRIPFVGTANSKVWLRALERMLDANPVVVIPGHGAASLMARQDMELTRSYLLFLREKMGAAVQEMTPFDEAYRQVDWSPFEKYPAFEQANRQNAYGTYMLMEQESLTPKEKAQ
jgi:glyoxylase-like metal-dependent hydrolase (beta-lactamase superfamily II)